MRRNPNLSFANQTAILFSVAVVMAPHVAHVPTWTTAFCTIALLLRLLGAWRRDPLPAKWLVFLFAAIAVGGVMYSYRTLFGRDSAVTLLLAMTVLKLLEMHARRDITVTVVLCYFLTIINFFYTQTIVTALYSLGAVWVVTATMVSLQHQAAPARLKQAVITSGILLSQAVPVMLVLFVLFPRVDGPLWGLPRIQQSGRSGLSDNMSPGSLARLSLSDAIAFRATFDSLPNNAKQLYWRGPVFWDYDGRTWRPGQRVTLSKFQFEGLGPSLRYSVTLEPHDQRWLFLIDVPSSLPQNSVLTRDYQVMAVRPVRQRLRYTAESTPRYRVGKEVLPSELQRALALPKSASPRTRAMVEEWRAEGLNSRQIADRALRMFRTQPFVYTLEPPPLQNDPVDQFLFETRRGFCEHYASSFAVMMRAAGVPARVVTGYLGGEVNPVDGYLVVRQSEAHAWTEVWLRGEGWVRIDPTAAVSPLRIQSGLANAVSATDSQPLLRRTQLQWMIQMRHQWDAATNSWNQWVLGYSPERQYRFLSSFGLSNIGWQDMLIALMFATAIIIISFALVMFMRIRGRRVDQIQYLWLRYCKSMAAKGVERKPSEGPKDFTERVVSFFPSLRNEIRRIGNLYIDLRYGIKKVNAATIYELRKEIAALRRQTSTPVRDV
jgi:transglutaminase-like putative cysteine protease